MRVSKEQKERLVEPSKEQNKSLTQYVLDTCLIEDVDTNRRYTPSERIENATSSNSSNCAKILNVERTNWWIK